MDYTERLLKHPDFVTGIWNHNSNFNAYFLRTPKVALQCFMFYGALNVLGKKGLVTPSIEITKFWESFSNDDH